jgi:ABC-type lipoprotein release transport system permease subunit
MKPLEPASIFAALGILVIAAVAAVAIPATRASALRPMDALRQE